MSYIFHGSMLFIVAFVLIVSILASTVYVVLSGMFTDTYRYEAMAERVNERLRMASAVYGSTIVYGVRNIAPWKVDLSEIGVIRRDGSKTVLATDVPLKPGEYIIGTSLSSKNAVALYAVTSRGNVFTTPVVNVTEATVKFRIRNLVPSSTYAVSPIHQSASVLGYVVGLAAEGYAFAYIYADDPYSDDHVSITFGPYRIRDVMNSTGTVTEQRQIRSKVFLLAAEVNFGVEASSTTGFKATLGFEVDRTDGRKGIVLHVCLGFIWSTISSKIYGLNVSFPKSSTYCMEGTSGQRYRYCECFGARVLPAVGNISSIIPVLADPSSYSVGTKAPSGSSIYIVLSKCYLIETEQKGTIKTVPPNFGSLPGGFKIFSSLSVPGINYLNTGAVYTPYVEVEATVDPYIYVASLLFGI